MKNVLDMFRRAFKLRTCKTNILLENVEKGKYDVCLDYHIKNCCAPCIGDVSKETYAGYIEQIKKILNGKTYEVINYLKKQMTELAAQLRFEDAQEIKERYDVLISYHAKNIISLDLPQTVEVYSMIKDGAGEYLYVNFMKLSNGFIIRSVTREFKIRMDDDDKDIFATAVTDFHFSELNIGNNAVEIILPFELDFELSNVKITIPKLGDKKTVLEWSVNNCRKYMDEQQRQRSLVDPDASVRNIMRTMMNDLQLDEEPRHIECFDNSNIQGTLPVSSCVVFKDGKPSKKDYRLFNVKTVVGADDFATMREVIFRRYKRLYDEGDALPQLIVIDGGKGQLRCAYETLCELHLEDRIPVIGIAND